MQKNKLATLHNAVLILRIFTKEQPDLNLTEISKGIGLNVSSTKRLVNTLLQQGFLQKNHKTKRYMLGYSLLSLCGIIKATMEIHKEAKPVMEQLARELGVAIHLGILEGTEIVYLEKVESTYPLRLFSHIGKKNPAYCTGCGKIMLAFQKPSLLESTLTLIESEGYYPYGENTVIHSEELLQHLVKIKRQGYSVCYNEFHEGVSIGAPIYNYTGEVIASISATGPNSHIHIQDIPHFTKHIVDAGKVISKKLGYYF